MYTTYTSTVFETATTSAKVEMFKMVCTYGLLATLLFTSITKLASEYVYDSEYPKGPLTEDNNLNGYIEVDDIEIGYSLSPMAVVTDMFDIDSPVHYKFKFTIHNYKSVPVGEVVVSNTFTYDGDSWQLEVTKQPNSRNSGTASPVCRYKCQLQLMTANPSRLTKAKIAQVCANRPSSPLYVSDFYQSGDKQEFRRIIDFLEPNDDLRVEVLVLRCIKSVSKDLSKTQIEPPKSQLSSVVLKWFKTEDFGDTTVVAADGNKFRCHRDILAARSEVFQLMFNAGMKEEREKVVNIKDFDGEIVVAMLQFLYSDECGEIGPIADRLYVAAHQYQLDRLKILCESALAANLSAKTVVKVHRLATFYHLEKLLGICVDYLDSHKAELSIGDLLAESLKIQEGNEGEVEQK